MEIDARILSKPDIFSTAQTCNTTDAANNKTPNNALILIQLVTSATRKDIWRVCARESSTKKNPELLISQMHQESRANQGIFMKKSNRRKDIRMDKKFLNMGKKQRVMVSNSYSGKIEMTSGQLRLPIHYATM